MKRTLLFISFAICFCILSTVAQAQNQTVANGAATTAVTFPGGGCVYNWVNDTPGIGLAATGTGNIASFTAINTTNKPITATITATPVGFAYMANGSDNTVSVINTTTNVVVATIPVGLHPVHITTSHDGSKVYVANLNSATISVIDAATNTVSATIPVPGSPQGMKISPDGSLLYATTGGNISVISTATYAILKTIATGLYCSDITISPDGSRLYVANVSSNSVSVINAATYTVIATINVGEGPNCLAITPDGSRLYVAAATNIQAGPATSKVCVISTATNSVLAKIQVGTSGTIAVAISPDGNRVYLTSVYAFLSNVVVYVIDATTNTLIATIPINGTYDNGISISPDGSRVYVSNYTSNAVEVINTATNTVIASVAVGNGPSTIGEFVTAGPGCTGSIVTFTIMVEPTITITASGTLQALTTTYGTPSASESFTVSGINTNGGILVTPPAGFEVSTDNLTFGNTVTVGSSGNVVATPVYIRLAAITPVGIYPGNIILSSTGATSVNEAMPAGTVNPAPLTITANNKNKHYGAINPALTITYTGFVNGETPAQLTVQPIITTTALTASLPGKYPITVSGAVSPNYTINYVPGTLIIIPPIDIPNTFTPNGDGINDTWNIKNIENYPGLTLEIYNRYGQLIYRSVGYSKPWDGTFNGMPLPVASYYYILDPKDGSPKLSGAVLIIR
jgi:gliding motility-associated-like protein